MGRIVPSHAVSAITKIFPDAASGCSGNFKVSAMSDVKGVLEIITKIPEELFALNDQDYADFIVALSKLQIISEWLIAKGTPEAERTQPAWNYAPGMNPVGRIINALKQCPDEYPPPPSTEPLFITDYVLRESIRRDVGATYRTLNNNEWKAATVLGGAAIEALLHWRLGQPIPMPTEIAAAITALNASQDFKAPPCKDDWVLYQFIAVADELKLIRPNTAKAADLARNFRNLIHPGTAIREKQLCDRATARSAVAALEHVIRDLS